MKFKQKVFYERHFINADCSTKLIQVEKPTAKNEEIKPSEGKTLVINLSPLVGMLAVFYISRFTDFTNGRLLASIFVLAVCTELFNIYKQIVE